MNTVSFHTPQFHNKHVLPGLPMNLRDGQIHVFVRSDDNDVTKGRGK